MKHFILALLLAFYTGCSVKILTFNDNSTSSKPYEFSLFEVEDKKEK